MVAYGVTTVLDLRSQSELVRTPNPFAGVSAPRYVHRVLIDDANMNKIGEAGDMLGRYLMILGKRRDAFREVFTAVAEADGCILFHCYAGKDRTGLIAAMLLAMAGVSREKIASDYGETDIQLAKQYEVWINEATPENRETTRNELRCPPERILGVLDYLDTEWGGVEAYLEAAGMGPSDLAIVRNKLR